MSVTESRTIDLSHIPEPHDGTWRYISSKHGRLPEKVWDFNLVDTELGKVSIDNLKTNLETAKPIAHASSALKWMALSVAIVAAIMVLSFTVEPLIMLAVPIGASTLSFSTSLHWAETFGWRNLRKAYKFYTEHGSELLKELDKEIEGTRQAIETLKKKNDQPSLDDLAREISELKSAESSKRGLKRVVEFYEKLKKQIDEYEEKQELEKQRQLPQFASTSYV